jgi:hypothetical protein
MKFEMSSQGANGFELELYSETNSDKYSSEKRNPDLRLTGIKLVVPTRSSNPGRLAVSLARNISFINIGVFPLMTLDEA